ncbi:MAG TPA: ferritin-like domain-containing protein [Dinghuibacter sp.]|jgi:ferritin-like metal-binding protein YciE|uniref:YciE/YciF ferroxidase family protein n=1 Tax=Dinghuibacter sp. TaxID=2024697 RepID=UPI002C62F58A|nr:ferritin-like domain-containing protein [Dinghuibacter sp.]HTJ14246.1 ferritin-like domain-containing protein [Dinghuibacter sp.]
MPRNSTTTKSRQASQKTAVKAAKPATPRTQRPQAATGGESAQGNAGALEKFFLSQLHDVYMAEHKILESLPKMQEAATTEDLKEAFEDHLHQTQRHVRRLEKVFAILGKEPEQKECKAIEGIVAEAEEIMQETEEGTMTRDAALIMAAQKVEHYEIATYGTLVQLSLTMGLKQVADLLDRTLVEEEQTDALLTDIAESEINLDAEHEATAYSWDDKRTRQAEEEPEDEKEEAAVV